MLLQSSLTSNQLVWNSKNDFFLLFQSALSGLGSKPFISYFILSIIFMVTAFITLMLI